MTRPTATPRAAQPALTPKLRFPEFRAGPGWEQSPLSKFVQSLDAGVSVNSGDRPATNGELGILKTSAVTNGVFEPNENKVVTSESERERLSEPVTANTIIISRMNTPALVGANAYVAAGIENLFLPDRLWAAKPRANASMRFVAFILGSDKGRAALATLATGTSGSMKNITKPDVLGLLIAAPSPAEQQKIAACLSTLEELIGAESQKLEALKAQKKGLTQQLFPREGETLPRLRFPEFHSAPEWEETQIGDLKPFVTSGSRGWAEYYSDQGELFVRITNLSRESIYLDLEDSKFVKLPLAATEGVRTQLKEHDVLISITADIGIIGYVDASVPSPAYINQHIALVRFGAANICSKFVAYFLAAEPSQKLFRATTDIGTKAGMNLNGIQKIKLVLPKRAEQNRIATCLTSLDDLIAAQSDRLAALQTHKQGLLQQFFPSPATPDA